MKTDKEYHDFHNKKKRKKWREHVVDAEIEDDWLVRLNDLPDIDVTSLCYGHLGAPSLFDRRPSIIFSVDDISFARYIVAALKRIGKTNWITWTTSRNFVTHVDGILRRDIRIPAKDLNAPKFYSITTVGPYLTGKNESKLRDWWERVILTLERLSSYR